LAAQTPIAVIMSTGWIAASPGRLLASGCVDISSNLAAVKDWALAQNLRNDYYSSYAAALSELAAHLVIENASTIKPRLEESAWFVCKALVSSGVAMSISGSSRPASGSAHKFSHALDRIANKPGLHGEQCGARARVVAASDASATCRTGRPIRRVRRRMWRSQSVRDSCGSRLEAPTIRVPAPRAPRSGGPTVKPRLGPPGSPPRSR